MLDLPSKEDAINDIVKKIKDIFDKLINYFNTCDNPPHRIYFKQNRPTRQIYPRPPESDQTEQSMDSLTVSLVAGV